MKIKRKSDEKVFLVYNIQYLNKELKFLIYDNEKDQWVFSSAQEFIPIEEEYFG